MKSAVRPKKLTAAITAAIIAGSGPAAIAQVNLSDVGGSQPGFRIDGDNQGDQSGISVSGAGDVNGDGLADTVLGAPYADVVPYSNAGKGYVVFGKTTNTTVETETANAAVAQLDGVDSSDLTGLRISGAGDVNGDGIADFIIGAKGADLNSDYYQEGGAYVVFGQPGMSSFNLSNLGSGNYGGFRIRGVDYSYSNAGSTISGAGDVNGDGFDDLLIGAPNSGTPYFLSGQAYVVFGKNDNVDVSLSSLGSQGFAITGAPSYSYLGRALSGAGDINGDGLDDIVVLTPSYDTAYAVFGKADSYDVDVSTLAADSNGFVINASLAERVSGAGDVNGDGLADLIVGAPTAAGGGTNRGESYVVFGKASTTAVNAATLAADGNGFVISGAADGDQAGSSVGGAGDVNGDGFADLIVGAPYATANTYANAGQAFVVFGQSGTSPISLAALSQGFSMDGEQLGDYAGTSVASAGDVNGDGLNDVIVGADRADPPNGYTQYTFTYTEAGKSYVVFSTETPPAQATYQAFAKAGDAPILAVGVVGDGSNASSPDTRMWIDFADGSNISNQAVTIHRAPLVFGGDGVSAAIHWQVTTDRTGFTGANIAVRYTDAEVSGINEADLTIFQAPKESGPFTPVATTRNAGANLVAAPVGSFSSTVIALGVAPEIDVQNASAVSIADGGMDAIGSQTAGTPVNLTYTVLNTGSGDMSVSSPTPGGLTNVSGFSVTQAPAGSVAPGGSTTFDIQFTPDLDGAFSLDLSFINGDADENAYDFTVTGTAVGEPEIRMRRDSVDIPDGGTDDLGDVILGPASVTYRVTNVVAATKNLSVGTPAVANPSNVSIQSITSPASPLAPGESTTFTVDYSILDFGPFSFDIDLPNSDANEANYDIAVIGNGTDTQLFETPMDLMAGDAFGMAVASFGNLFAVGIPGDGMDPGRVIVYRIEGSALTIEQVIDVPAGFTAAQFGASLDLEGDRLLVGAPGTSSMTVKGPTTPLQAALFQRVQGQWNMKSSFSSTGSSTDDQFGSSVSLSGGMVAIGAPGDDGMGSDAGAAYIFEMDDVDNVIQSVKVMPPDANAGGNFGASVSASQGKFAVGAPGSQIGGATAGSVSMFQTLSTNLANPLGTLQGSQSTSNGDQFGSSVSLDGGMLMVGAPGEDDGASDTGAAYLFSVGGQNLVQMGRVAPDSSEANSGFGTAVAISAGKIAIGAPGASSGKGNVSLFGLNLALQQQIAAGLNQAGFGTAVAIDPQNLVIGAPASGSFSGLATLQRDPDILFSGSFEQGR